MAQRAHLLVAQHVEPAVPLGTHPACFISAGEQRCGFGLREGGEEDHAIWNRFGAEPRYGRAADMPDSP